MAVVTEIFSKSFLSKIIEDHSKNGVEILKVDTAHVVPPGENYVSELLRITVQFRKNNSTQIQTIPMIIKRILENEYVKQFDAVQNVFGCELNFYSNVLPLMEELAHFQKVAPSLYYLSKERKTLVVEDLKALNYKMAARQEGLDLNHCLMAVKKLAYFHAGSLKIYEKAPHIVEQFNKGIFSKNHILERILSIAFEEIVKVCEKVTSLKKYSCKFSNDLREKSFLLSARDSKFNVLCHGDLWCNNLMYRYDEHENLEDIVFVDYQGSVFTSPVYDLHYFLVTSTNFEVKINHFRTILRHYHKNLMKNLNIFNVKAHAPNFSDFEKEFRDKAYIGFAAMCFTLPFVKADRRNDSTLAGFLGSAEKGSFRHHCFTNSYFINTIECLLPFYDSLGVFN